MSIFSPLKSRSISYLWTGQVFSAIGDEIYTVALVWFSADLIGNDTGYIMAVQATSILAFSLLGGIWADRWDQRKTMVVVDVIRGLSLLAAPIAVFFGFFSLWILVFITIVVSSLKAFFPRPSSLHSAFSQ